MELTITNTEEIPGDLPPGTYCCRLESATWQEMKIRFVPGSQHQPGDCLIQMVKEDTLVTNVPPPTFPHCVYGVNLTAVGDDGAMMAEGHVPLVRFVAACNNMARNEFGCRNLLDYSEATLAEALEGTRHTWVLPIDDPDGDCDWYVKYNATAETPGAVPVTLWEP